MSGGVVLVLNAGSSSLKFSVFSARDEPDPEDLILTGKITGIGQTPQFSARDPAGAKLADETLSAGDGHDAVLARLLPWIEDRLSGRRIFAAGHRIVHGGTDHVAPTRLTAETRAALRRLVPLAPLHQPHNLDAVDALARLYPGLTQIGCFDTAFHHRQPEVAAAFALPPGLGDQPLRRYGFHGLSSEYVTGRLAGLGLGPGRTVIAHLGNGASMCAVKDGVSIATTMGFTALDGLPMGTRSGAVDPGVILYLMEERGMSASAVSDLLYNRSGLLGVSGVSNDMRTLLASPEPAARFAIDLFCYRIGRELGSLAAALGGLDTLVFTAGIGENSPEIRARVTGAAEWLGIALDDAANRAGKTRISTQSSDVEVLVIATNEELVIARHAWKLAGNDRQSR